MNYSLTVRVKKCGFERERSVVMRVEGKMRRMEKL
jgi:hypothetical protein